MVSVVMLAAEFGFIYFYGPKPVIVAASSGARTPCVDGPRQIRATLMRPTRGAVSADYAAACAWHLLIETKLAAPTSSDVLRDFRRLDSTPTGRPDVGQLASAWATVTRADLAGFTVAALLWEWDRTPAAHRHIPPSIRCHLKKG